ncbi:hypothetical protein OIU34_21975 [Pararhizobium sp. BT-229]|uniref:hypothetical protein n=1 Tax=Pararhizobium sp. BT-229 TaxID=2986923 RepID=UPI0021F6D025|nr:hypothetical protein [Pararhizobium sp. BT-229]MCV9964561.1 hypothetical protein [Pararhizobium sp. BT-229]
MKVRVKCPVVVDVLPAKLNTPRKIVLTTWREHDLPEPANSEGAYEAARCETPMSGTSIKTKRVFKTEHAFFTQVPDANGNYPDGLNVTVPGRLSVELSNRVAQRTEAMVKAILKDKAVKFTPPHGHTFDDLLMLPDIERYDGVLVDPQAYEDQLLAIDQIIKEYAVIGDVLYKRTEEPFYAVSLSESVSSPDGSPYVGMTLVTDGNPGASTIACFKVGRLDDALEFVREIEQTGARQGLPIHGHRKLEEAPGATSEFPDVETTVAMAAKRTADAFEASFDLFRRPKESLAEALYDTPLEQIATARRLHAATKGKAARDLVADADHLFELLEEVASYGETSRFTKKTIPLNMIVSLWEDREIDIDLPASSKRPSP